MKEVEFTKLSSKGQLVIPREIRDEFHLEAGTLFAVIAHQDTILLKRVAMPKIKTWKHATQPFRKAAHLSRLKKEDIEKIISEVRGYNA